MNIFLVFMIIQGLFNAVFCLFIYNQHEMNKLVGQSLKNLGEWIKGVDLKYGGKKMEEAL